MPRRPTRLFGAHQWRDIGLRMIEWARSTQGRRVGGTVGLLLMVYVIWQLVSTWSTTAVPWESVAWPLALVSLGVWATASVVMMIPWVYLSGGRRGTRRRLLACALTAQCGKFIPGGAVAIVGRVGLAARQGVAAGSATVAVAGEMLLAPLACIAFFPLAFAGDGLPVWLAITMSLFGLALLSVVTTLTPVRARARRWMPSAQIPESARDPNLVARAVLIYSSGWILQGLSFWLLAQALLDEQGITPLIAVGVWALAWFAGFVVFFIPAGLGVRELVLVALLGSQLGADRVLLLATVFRVMTMTVDIALGLLASPTAVRGGRTRPQSSSAE